MNVYEVVTTRIVQALEAGVIPWRKPWHTEAPKNLVSGRAYRGVNILLLESTSFASPCWVTFRQALALKGTVRKGEQGTPVVFFQRASAEDEKDDRKRRGFLRYYSVFNIEQCEGIEAPPPVEREPFNPITRCDEIVRGYRDGPRIDHGRSRACYIPIEDTIEMPLPEAFTSADEYYSCLFHEFAHSTGAHSRLNRRGVTDPVSFGSHAYSFEELVAEIGSSFLCAESGILTRTIDNSASYISHWARRLRQDPTWIVRASSEAATAATFVLGKAANEAGDESSVAA
jgi:antirestriction protein ArdC